MLCSVVMMHVVMLRVMAPSKRPTLKCENNCFRKSENSFSQKLLISTDSIRVTSSKEALMNGKAQYS